MNTTPKYIIVTAVTIISLLLLWYFRAIVAYVLIAAVVAIVGKPVMDMLLRIHFKKRRMPRWGAALITETLIWLIFAALFSIFIPLFVSKINELSNLNGNMFHEAFTGPIKSLEIWLINTLGLKPDFSLTDSILSELKSLLNIDMINSFISSFVTIAGNIGIALFSITFIAFFFLKDENMFCNILVTIFPRKYEANIRNAMDSVGTLLMRYFTGIIAESLILTTFVSVVLLIFGSAAREALFIGMFVGLLNVIPYVGPLIAFCVSLIIAMLSPIAGFTFFGTIFVVGATVLTAQLIDNMLLQPLLYSNRVKAHPLEIFIVILVAGNVGGVIGMLLAIPSYNVIRVFAKEFFNKFRVVQKLTEKI